MKKSEMFVKFESLTVGENVRLLQNMNLGPLFDSILAIGLQEPIMVWSPKPGVYEIIRGHRRFAVIGMILGQEPARFAELFGKGVPVTLVKDITSEEAVLLKLDHSEQVGLADPYELQVSANMLFAINKTEEEVSILLAGLIDRIAPMNSKVRVELQEKQKKIDEAKAAGNAAAVTLAERDYRKREFDYRRGFVQGLHNAARCPIVVMHALYKRATGKAPEGVTEYLPLLTSADVTSLWLAHKEDLSVMENGVQKFSRVVTGPLFGAKWAELVTKGKEADGKPKVAKAKAMSAKEMVAERTEGKLKSKLAQVTCAKHAGEEYDAALLNRLDEIAKVAELVESWDKELWDEVVESAKLIEAKLVEQAKQAK